LQSKVVIPQAVRLAVRIFCGSQKISLHHHTVSIVEIVSGVRAWKRAYVFTVVLLDSTRAVGASKNTRWTTGVEGRTEVDVTV